MTTAAALDADLGDLLAAGDLGVPPADLAAFERAFIDHVEASGPDPAAAWDAFYDATLARVTQGPGHGSGTVATFSRIWARAIALSRGESVLDLGTCFGFLPLAWATRPGHPLLLAADLSEASASLLQRQADRRGAAVQAICADALRLPLAGGSVDSVMLLHVLEHLTPTDSLTVLDEALRVARRRVVVAVPVEPAPDPVFGHLQVFDLPRLAALGRRTGWWVSLFEADGAWLVLDRPQESGDISSRPSCPER
jgi:hypothetical protein